jgi:TfoX/Sxy family transcriptional regulator of competence genes
VAYDESLATRLREAVGRRAGVSEKEMFGGLALLLHGNMFIGILGSDLMVRVGKDAHDECLNQPGARPMDFTGKPMNGYVFVGPDGCRTEQAVGRWVARGAEFVATLAKPSRTASKRRPAGRARRTGR